MIRMMSNKFLEISENVKDENKQELVRYTTSFHRKNFKSIYKKAKIKENGQPERVKNRDSGSLIE